MSVLVVFEGIEEKLGIWERGWFSKDGLEVVVFLDAALLLDLIHSPS